MEAYQTEKEYREPDEIQIPSEHGYIVIPTYEIRAEKTPPQAAKTEKKKHRSSVVGSVLQAVLMVAGMAGLMVFAGLDITGTAGLLLIGVIGSVGLLTYKASADEVKNSQKRQAVNQGWRE